MKPLIASLALAVALVLSGCSSYCGGVNTPLLPIEPGANRPDSSQVCRQAPIEEPLCADQAVCPAWRQVATKRTPDAACPQPKALSGGKWEVRHLFHAETAAESWSAEYAAALPPALRPFCVYETTANQPQTLDKLQKQLERINSLRDINMGCASVTPSAERWEFYQEHFLQQEAVDWISGLESDVERDDPPRGAVDLVFLDTQPDGSNDAPGRSDHGFALARLAEDLLCDPGTPPCRARIHHQLALPIADFDPNDMEKTVIDSEGGGYFGRIGDLANALQRALDTSEAQRLVINLSVAWVGETFGGNESRPKDMPVPVQALYEMLRVASCRGALVVTAAGNRLGGPDVEYGPLMPAAWERFSAPTAQECVDILGEPDSFHGATRPEPLVYAVAGVRADGMPLANARPGSIPPRVAFADHAVALLPSGPDDPRIPVILTGSSVSTTVVTATAAAVWAERPDLSRAELMDLLERSGTELPDGRRADFPQRSKEAPEVRRISRCSALAEACNHQKACPSGRAECPAPPPLPQLSATSDESCQSVTLDTANLTEELTEATQLCGTRKILFDPASGMPLDPCPFLQYYGIAARHWTGPQPGSNPCSSCPARPPADTGGEGGFAPDTLAGYVLDIQIDPEWPRLPDQLSNDSTKSNAIRQVFLDIGDVSYSLGLRLEPGDCATVTGIDESLIHPDGKPTPPIALRFMTDFGSFESPIILTR